MAERPLPPAEPKRPARVVSRLAAEFVVVVVGVFVALWADSCSERRSELRSRAELLGSLASELRTNVAVLDSAATRADGLVEGMRRLMAMHDGIESVPGADSLEVLLGAATSFWRADQQGLGFGVYDGMVATGAARLLPRREIGERLARHRRSLVNGQGDEDLAERALEHVIDVLREHGGVLAFMPGRHLDRRGIADRDRPRNLSGLLADPAFADALYTRIVYESNIVAFYRRQIGELEATLRLIDAELDDPGAP